MVGFFSADASKTYEDAAEEGKPAGKDFGFTLTIISDDLEEMLAAPQHSAKAVGSVVAPALSPDPLTATQGVFNLFVQDPEQANTRRMLYAMTLTSVQGKTYDFNGFKLVRDDPGFDIWADNTTLYITVRENGPTGEIVGKGILRISADDFAKQLSTVQVTNAASLGERLKYLDKFSRFFGRTLVETYGGVAGGLLSRVVAASHQQK
jgi:cholesterol oxidase